MISAKESEAGYDGMTVIPHDGYFSTDTQAMPPMMVVCTRAIMAELTMAVKEVPCIGRGGGTYVSAAGRQGARRRVGCHR